MKKKNIIKRGLLTAALLLGTGYAVINSKEVTINGTVKSADDSVSYSLEFTNHNVVRDGDTYTLSDITISTVGTPYTIDVYHEFYGNSFGDSDILANVEVIVENSNPEFFSVEVEGFPERPTFGTDNGRIIITMIKTPVTEKDSTCSIKIKLNISPVRA